MLTGCVLYPAAEGQPQVPPQYKGTLVCSVAALMLEGWIGSNPEHLHQLFTQPEKGKLLGEQHALKPTSKQGGSPNGHKTYQSSYSF